MKENELVLIYSFLVYNLFLFFSFYFIIFNQGDNYEYFDFT